MNSSGSAIYSFHADMLTQANKPAKVPFVLQQSNFIPLSDFSTVATFPEPFHGGGGLFCCRIRPWIAVLFSISSCPCLWPPLWEANNKVLLPWSVGARGERAKGYWPLVGRQAYGYRSTGYCMRRYFCMTIRDVRQKCSGRSPHY